MILELLHCGTNIAAAPPAPDDDYWYRPVTPPSASGISVDSDLAMRVGAVYACVRVLAETVASLPLFVYRRLSPSGKERAQGHPVYKLLHERPNEWQTSFEFRELLMMHLCLRGNGFAEIRPGTNGAIDSLWPLHPDRVKVYRKDNQRVFYEVRDPRTGRARELRQDQMFHVRALSTDGLRGLNPIEVEADVVSNAMATDQHAGAFFKNGARPGGVVETPQKLTDKAVEHLRRSWEELHRGPENAHKLAILEQDLKYSPITIAGRDAQFIENRKYNVTDIARIFRVPPHMIGDLERATFSNVEQQAIDFVQHTIRPWLVRWEQAISRDVMDDEDEYFAEFLVDGLLRGDAQTRAQSMQIQFMNGALTIDEWREIENRNPLPDGLGQQHFVPLNMTPVERALEEPEEEAAPPPPALPAPPPPEDETDAERRAAFDAIVSDTASRIIAFELRKIDARIARLDKERPGWERNDRERFNVWVGRQYDAQAELAKVAIRSVENAWLAMTGKRRSLIGCVLATAHDNLRLLRDMARPHLAVETIARHGATELSKRILEELGHEVLEDLASVGGCTVGDPT